MTTKTSSCAGTKFRILKDRDPANLPWKKLEIDVVLESTGFFTSRDKAELHLKAGAKRVLISAPAKNPDATICIGINDNIYDPGKDKIVSNASCTTNCLAPMAKVLHDKFGITHGFMSTIHSYTNDQRILDFPHSDLRRARAAAINIIPSTTGAAKAIGEVIPDLKGKLNGGSFRIPTPDGSVTDLTAALEKDATVDASMPHSKKLRRIKATKVCSNIAMKRSFRRTSWATTLLHFSTAIDAYAWEPVRKGGRLVRQRMGL